MPHSVLDEAQIDAGLQEMRGREDVLPEFLLRDPGRGCVVMGRALAHSPDIRFLRPCGQATELEVLKHPLLEWGHGAPYG